MSQELAPEDGASSSGADASGAPLPAWARPAMRVDPAAARVRLPEGEVVNGRFRVLNLLGEGGMGEVYRVLDLRSQTERALKTIKTHFLKNEEIRRRFQRELLDAQRITHRNVCRVYDSDSTLEGAQERPFYTMELLAGETLAQFLSRNGPVPAERALRIIRGIAAGLDAAHTTGQGIIHRDLKPANVMLVEAPEGLRPIILDFGIAKRLGGSPDGQDVNATKTGVTPGTPAWMAPEQQRGEPVSAATDVWALAKIASQILLPGDARTCQRVLSRGLADLPARRYGTAGALADALNSALRSRRLLLRAAVVAPVGFAAGGGALWWWSAPHAGPTSGTPLVLLVPTSSASAEGASIRLPDSSAVHRLLLYQAGRSQAVELISPRRIAERLKQLSGGTVEGASHPGPSEFRKLAEAEGAPFVVFSEIGSMAGRLQLRVTLEVRGRARENDVFAFASPDELPAVAEEVADWLRRKLNRPGLKPRDPGLPELTTAKWAALQAYVRGDEAWAERREPDAIRWFLEALRIDPEFCGAEARLGDVLLASFRVDEALAHWAKASEMIRTRALAGREMLRIRGLFANDTGQFEEAERAFALFRATYPSDPLAYFYYAGAARRAGRTDQALELMQTAVKLDGRNYAFRIGLARVYLWRGENRQARAELEAAVPLQPADGWARHGLAAIALVEGRPAECRQWLEAVMANGHEKARSLAMGALACLHAELGQMDECGRRIAEGIEADRKTPDLLPTLHRKLRLQAEWWIQRGEPAEGRVACRRMLELRLGTQARLEAGCWLARAGEWREAAALMPSDLPDWPLYRHWMGRLAAEIAFAKGDPGGAWRIAKALPDRADSPWWPEFAWRMALAAGHPEEAARLVEPLRKAAPWYWVDPDRTGLGFLRLTRVFP